MEPGREVVRLDERPGRTMDTVVRRIRAAVVIGQEKRVWHCLSRCHFAEQSVALQRLHRNSWCCQWTARDKQHPKISRRIGPCRQKAREQHIRGSKRLSRQLLLSPKRHPGRRRLSRTTVASRPSLSQCDRPCCLLGTGVVFARHGVRARSEVGRQGPWLWLRLLGKRIQLLAGRLVLISQSIPCAAKKKKFSEFSCCLSACLVPPRSWLPFPSSLCLVHRNACHKLSFLPPHSLRAGASYGVLVRARLV